MDNIFIRLLEGTETFVPVEAKHLGSNIFEITKNSDLDLEEDVTSIWEFFPGDVVSCEKREDIRVATELLRSTFPNRRLYELIFQIVESFGRISLEELSDYRIELQELTNNTSISQRKHPVVREWIERNSKTASI